MPLRFEPSLMSLQFDPAGDPRRPWVAAAWHALHNGVLRVYVPPGFRCDLASVPDWLMALAPPSGAHQRAAFFHDALYRFQVCTRTTADAVFDSVMEADGVPAWRRKLLYLAVRLFGGRAWRANALEVDAARQALLAQAQHSGKRIDL